MQSTPICAANGERIRAIREAKNLSQGEIEKACGLFRVYISRVENGHLVPSIETLEKLARALEVLLYQFFYEGKKHPLPPHLPKRKRAAEITWGTTRQRNLPLEQAQGISRAHERIGPAPFAPHGPEVGEALVASSRRVAPGLLIQFRLR